MSAATKSPSNIDCSAEESCTPILYCPRVSSTDDACEASLAAAQLELQENPPEWLQELNWLMDRVQCAPQIESMSVTEAEECLVAMRRKKSEDDNLLQCVTDAMQCLFPLGMDMDKSLDLMKSIFGHFGRSVSFSVSEHPAGDPGCAPIAVAAPGSTS